MDERMNIQERVETFRISELNIYDLVKKGILDELQEKLSAVSNMAFLTVDYRGEPVSKWTKFTEFCVLRRKNDCSSKTCILCNAYGGAAAAIHNKPYLYKCPAGMVHIAVPIVIGQQYLGTLIGGQIKCQDAYEMDDFGATMADDKDWTLDPDRKEMYEKIPVMTMKQVEDIAGLVALYVSQMCEREEILQEKEKLGREKKRFFAENQIAKETEKKSTQPAVSNRNTPFVLNILNSVAGLACIEDAKQTEEMVHLLIQILHYQEKSNDILIPLKEELEQVEAYLKIQKLRFEEKMEYQIVREKQTQEQLIPPKILLPFVENAIIYGVVAHKGTGKIRIHSYMEMGECVIDIEDEGGISMEQLENAYESIERYYESNRISGEIYETRQRLMKRYGSRYDIELSGNGNSGTRVRIRIPQSVERIQRYV